MHWRDKRAATSWDSLQFQVRRWQDAASLGWSDSDILEVSRYLNQTIYHFEQTKVSSRRHGDAEVVSSLDRAASLRLP
jgi:hypothetical protein